MKPSILALLFLAAATATVAQDQPSDCNDIHTEVYERGLNLAKACNCEPPYDDCQLTHNVPPTDHVQEFYGCKPNADEACKSAISSFAEALENVFGTDDTQCPIPEDVYNLYQKLNANCNNNRVSNRDTQATVCSKVLVEHTKHPTKGDTGMYFAFSKASMDAMLGYKDWNGKEISVVQEGSHAWKGNVIIWNNQYGKMGRRVSGSGSGQWAKGDTITLSLCSGNPQCDTTVGDTSGNCCTVDHPCGILEGDCDKDSECIGNLVCGKNNCGRESQPNHDCCTHREAADQCSGINVLPDILDKFVGNKMSLNCAGAKLMKEVTSAATCAASNLLRPFEFGKLASLFDCDTTNDANVPEVLCQLISKVLPLGIKLPPAQCKAVHDELLRPIIEGKVDLDIESFVESTLKDILGVLHGLLDTIGLRSDEPKINNRSALEKNRVLGLMLGVKVYANFIDFFDFCPAVVTSPDWLKQKFGPIIEMVKLIQNGVNLGEKFAKNMENTVGGCRTYTYLMSAGLSFMDIASIEGGLYVTFDLSKECKVKEIGLFDGHATAISVGEPEVSVGVDITQAILMGDKSVWGEWGYTVDVGVSVPVYGVGVGVGAGLVFTADASPPHKLGSFIGFEFSSSVSVGVEDSTQPSFDASVSCGFVAAQSFEEKLKEETPQCGEVGDTLLENAKNYGTELAENHFKDFQGYAEKLERCGKLYECQAVQCVYNFDSVNFNNCLKSAETCSEKMNDCAVWGDVECKYNIETNGNTCQKRGCRTVMENVGCKKRACTTFTENTSCKVPNCGNESSKKCNWGIFSWFCKAVTSVVCNVGKFGCKTWNTVSKEVCNGVCTAWNTVAKTVCDGACITYNKVLKPVSEVVKTTADCVKRGGSQVISIIEKCAKEFPHCAKAAKCYIKKGAESVGKCAGGMIVPSKECFQESGIIN